MKRITKLLVFSLVSILSLGFFVGNTYADEEEIEEFNGTSIRLEPVSKIQSIKSSSVYDDSFKVYNDGKNEIKIEVYSAPYSYVYSEEEDSYKLGFNKENNYTQITRWISFDKGNGEYVEKTTFTIPSGKEVKINYRISTPSSIPAGGQYAVIFAHTLSSSTDASGIRTEASPGLVVYGRSLEGKTDTSNEIRDLKILQSVTENNVTRNNFYGSAKVKNTGNVDFYAKGRLKVDPIIGFASYETPNTNGNVSVIPETELAVFDEWKDTPSLGIYNVTWTVSAGDNTETISKIIFLIPFWFVVLIIMVLTFLTIWIIIRARKRKERRSRLAI